MSNQFAVIGGDLRIIELVKILAKENNIVYTYGLEKAEQLKNLDNVIICEKLTQVVKEAEVVIGPIPFSSNGTEINTPFSDVSISIRELMHALNAKIFAF